MTFKFSTLPIAALLALALSACASPKLAKLDICDGKDRRTANPYGVTLPGVPQGDDQSQTPEAKATDRNINVFGARAAGEGDAGEGQSGTVVPALADPQLSRLSTLPRFSQHKSC